MQNFVSRPFSSPFTFNTTLVLRPLLPSPPVRVSLVMTEFIGAKISLISRSDIRYVGILHEINSEDSTVALEQVRSYGTEGRRGGNEVPPSDNVFEYVVFRGSDVKDLKIEEAAKKPEPPAPAITDDPAILMTTAPPPRQQQSPGYPPMHQYGPPPPGYGNYQYPPPFGGPGGFRPPPQHMSPPEGFAYPSYPVGIPPPRAYSGPGPSPENQPQQVQTSQQPHTQTPQPQPQQAVAPPSPVKETKPDIAVATKVPTPIKLAPAQPTTKSAGVVPAMPIPISIPVQPKATKATPQLQQQQQAPPPPPPQPATQSPEPPEPSVADTANVTTATEIQNLAKNLSETKLKDSVPGAGSYLTQPRRRQFQTQVRKMDADYDFESANAKFNKEDIKKEVAQAQTSGTTESAAPSAAQLAAALAASDKFYDKGKSFFDNISCENKDRSMGPEANPNSWKRNEERRLNIETFGQASVDGGRYGRGSGRGGRGGYRGGRGGGYGRGRGNVWRGRGAATMNGQRSSETTTTTA